MIPRGSSGQLAGNATNQVPGGSGAEHWPTCGGLAGGTAMWQGPAFRGHSSHCALF